MDEVTEKRTAAFAHLSPGSLEPPLSSHSPSTVDRTGAETPPRTGGWTKWLLERRRKIWCWKKKPVDGRRGGGFQMLRRMTKMITEKVHNCYINPQNYPLKFPYTSKMALHFKTDSHKMSNIWIHSVFHKCDLLFTCLHLIYWVNKPQFSHGPQLGPLHRRLICILMRHKPWWQKASTSNKWLRGGRIFLRRYYWAPGHAVSRGGTLYLPRTLIGL